MELQTALVVIACLLFWRLIQSHFQHQDIKALFRLYELRHDRMMKRLRAISLNVTCLEQGIHPTEEDYQNIWRSDPSAPYGDGG
jgi:hypothetical protein